jgi:hypothetical protein
MNRGDAPGCDGLPDIVGEQYFTITELGQEQTGAEGWFYPYDVRGLVAPVGWGTTGPGPACGYWGGWYDIGGVYSAGLNWVP